MSWNNDVVLEFLELYRKEQHLWDPKHPLHRNRNENNDAWLRIKSSLSIHCSVVDLKKKKECLMTTFRSHMNKKKARSQDYRTTWFAYPLMESFLSEKYECDSTNQLEHEYINDNETYTSQTTTTPDYSGHQSIRPSTTKRHHKSAILSQNQTNTSKLKRNDNSSEFVYLPKQMNYSKNGPIEKRDTDEYELYGQLLAKKLRKLDEHQRDVAMHEIDNIMFRAKMQSSSSKSRSYVSSPSPASREIKSPIFIVTQSNNLHFDEEENTMYQDPMRDQ